MQLNFNIFQQSSNWIYNKNKQYKTWDYWSREVLNFDFSEKGLGSRNSFSTIFSACFLKKNLFHVISINWPNFIVWLPLLLEIWCNKCIIIVCFSGCSVMNFEINLSFLIKAFFYIIKKSRQKLKLLKKKRSF